MATNRVLQLLRSNRTYTSFDAAKTAVEGLTGHLDGEILLARYGTGTPDGTTATGPFFTAIGVYDLGHKKWTVFKSSDEIEAAIQALQDELDDTQEGAGLGEDGSYTAPVSGEAGFEVLGGGNAPKNLYDAIMALADAIAAMDHTKNYTAAAGANPATATDASKVISGVNQENGVLDTVTTDAVDLLLTGYQNTNASGDIAGTDTLKNALSKLENATSAGVKVSKKAGNQIQRIENDSTATNNGLYSHVEIAQLTEQEVTALSDSNVREAYKLINPTDRTAIGDVIKIYKDSSLTDVFMGHVDDKFKTPITGEITITDSYTNKSTDVQDGTGSEALVFIYHKEDGNYELVAVNVESFLNESEFGNGLQVVNHEVSVKNGNGIEFDANNAVAVKEYDGITVDVNGVGVNVGNGLEIDSTSKAVNVKIDAASEKDSQNTDFLTVGASGVKVQGINAEIVRKIEALDGNATATAAAANGDFSVLTKVNEVDGVVQAVGNGDNDSKEVLLKKVAATGAAADVSYDNTTAQMAGSPATVQAAIDKLDSRIDALGTDALESVTSTNGAIVVGDKAKHTQSLTFTLSPQAESTAEDAAYAGGNDTSNILQIKSDGLYLDSTWDCGVY